jgi:hypothetical protein
MKKGAFMIILILAGILLVHNLTRVPQRTNIPCSIIFEDGNKISDTCKQIDPSDYCEADISKYDEIVKTGDRIQAIGVCINARKGPGWIGP